MSWSKDEIEQRIAIDVECLAREHEHWLDVDRAAVAEALGMAASRGKKFYVKERAQLERLLAQAEARHTDVAVH